MSKIFQFMSREPFYTKERAGVKNNTTREIDLNDDRFLELITSMMNGFDDGDLKIEIIRAPHKDDSFTRDIRDISVYNNLIIITWNHKVNTKSKKEEIIEAKELQKESEKIIKEAERLGYIESRRRENE